MSNILLSSSLSNNYIGRSANFGQHGLLIDGDNVALNGTGKVTINIDSDNNDSSRTGSIFTISGNLKAPSAISTPNMHHTIKNFFGSIVLFIDKPFEMGDRIVVDGHDGPVEEVGIRSTKIRTLDGHLVTLPNGKLADMTIQNIGKRPFIRRLFSLTVTYDTPPEKIEKGIARVKEILTDHEGMQADFPPRVYFNDFNSDSLNIMVIYWYHPPNYWDFMLYNEKVNLQIMRAFAAEEIEFAFPTQTTYLAQDDRRPLHIRVSTDAKSNDPGGQTG